MLWKDGSSAADDVTILYYFASADVTARAWSCLSLINGL